MRKFLITFLMGILTFNFSYAGDDKQKQENHKSYKEKLTKKLDLSNEQVGQVEEIKTKYEGDLDRLKSEKKNLKKELKDMAAQNEKGEDIQNRLVSKHDELQNVKRDYEDKKFQMKLEVREVLTTDQIAKLDDIMEKKWKHKKGKYKQAQEESKQEQEDKQKQEESESEVQQQDEAESIEAQEQEEIESEEIQQQEEVEEESV